MSVLVEHPGSQRFQFMKKIESEIQAIMNADLSVTERAITIMLYIMRSQMFFDGNKRTAQLAANQIMIQGGAGVLRIPVECQKEFLQS